MGLRSRFAVLLCVLSLGGLAAAAASAHECFNTQRSAQADASIAKHSHGWFDIQTWQLYGLFTGACDPSQGPCLPVPSQFSDITAFGSTDPETLIGVILGFAPLQALPPAAQAEFGDWVTFLQSAQTAAAALGVPTHYLTLSNATASGGSGAAKNGNTANGKGIDHFPDVYGDQLIQAYLSVV